MSRQLIMYAPWTGHELCMLHGGPCIMYAPWADNKGTYSKTITRKKRKDVKRSNRKIKMNGRKKITDGKRRKREKITIQCKIGERKTRERTRSIGNI